MQRYFVRPEAMDDRSVRLKGDDARHLSQVMRAKPGDSLIASDGQGRDVQATISQVGKDEVVAQIVETLPIVSEMIWRVTIAQSLPKGDKLETVLQKGTEAGAFSFQPFVSERTVVQYDERKELKRMDRWRKIVKEAAEQSHRSVLPEVRSVCGWKQLLVSFERYDLILLGYEEEGRAGKGLKETLNGFRQTLPGGSAPNVLIVVGPEGGFSPREAEEAMAAGATVVGLGRRILRTETAGLFALVCVAYESGELGGNDKDG